MAVVASQNLYYNNPVYQPSFDSNNEASKAARLGMKLLQDLKCKPRSENSGSCFGCDGYCCIWMGNSGCDGEGCHYVWAVLGAMALFSISIISLVYTAINGDKAIKAGLRRQEIKEIKENACASEVKKVYDKMLPLLNADLLEKITHTGMNAILTVGFAFLTVSALIALTAASHQLLIPQTAVNWSIIGGAITGGALVIWGFTSCFFDFKKFDNRRDQCRELQQAIGNLEGHTAPEIWF